MAQEQAFLDQLAADPGDDVTRLVYADWLEDHGDPRAAFLRLEIGISRMTGDCPFPQIDHWAAVWQDIDHDWVRRVGKRFDLWLLGYAPDVKLAIIVLIREISWLGLGDCMKLIQATPARVQAGVWLPIIVLIVRAFRSLWTANAHLAEEQLPPRLAIRPAGSAPPEDADPIPRGPSSPGGERWGVYLNNYAPDPNSALTAALRQAYECNEAKARRVIRNGGRILLGYCFHESEARQFAESFAGLGNTEINSLPRQAVNWLHAEPHYEVELRAFDPSCRAGVIQALKATTGMAEDRLEALSADTLPLSLRSRMRGETVEWMRWFFPSGTEMVAVEQK